MKKGFTLIELLIVVGIIAILSVSSVVSLNVLNSRARDSTRRESLSAYATSLEQYKTSTGTYLVNLKNLSYGGGYIQDGWGRLTRKNGTPTSLTNYSSGYSIADLLQLNGYLTTLQIDPTLRNVAYYTDVKGTPAVAPIRSGITTNDYFLVVCDSAGNLLTQETSPVKTGISYALYANLENPPSSGPNLSLNHCGFNLTTSDSSIQPQNNFNYALGNL